MLLMSPGVGTATTPLTNRAVLSVAESFMIEQTKTGYKLVGNCAGCDDQIRIEAELNVYIGPEVYARIPIAAQMIRPTPAT